MKAGNLSLVKNINNSLVWSYVAQHAGASITEMAKKIGLSFPTVNRALEKGLEHGIIAQGEVNNSAVGRKPQIYKLNKNFAKILCIAIYDGYIKYELKDFLGETIEAGEYTKVRKDIVDDLIEIINWAVRKFKKIDLAALSIAGVIAGPVMVESCTYPVLNGMNLCDKLFFITGVKVVMENNMRNLGYTAKANTNNKEEKTVSVIRFSKEGVGNCNIIRGKIQRGNGGFAGEVGFIPFEVNDMKKPDIYAKIIISVIALVAPHELILYNELEKISDEDILSLVKKSMPMYAIPKVIAKHSCYDDQMEGIYLMGRGYLMALMTQEKNK